MEAKGAREQRLSFSGGSGLRAGLVGIAGAGTRHKEGAPHRLCQGGALQEVASGGIIASRPVDMANNRPRQLTAHADSSRLPSPDGIDNHLPPGPYSAFPYLLLPGL